MEMGITPGAEILVKGFAPLGDPMEFGIKGYSLSMRKSEASDIIVEMI
jgi:Fe2+ transport system protein FeoA